MSVGGPHCSSQGMGMDRRRGCQAPVGSSVTDHCCPPKVGAPRLAWRALSLCSVTWPGCHRDLEYVEAGPQGEVPGEQEVWGALGCRAQVEGWVAGATEEAAMVAARARRASEAAAARAPLPGLPLQRGRQKPGRCYLTLLLSCYARHRHYS